MTKKYVYNLEFPPHCNVLTIYGYKFTRVEDYSDRFALLQHLISGHSSEYKIIATNGQHTMTAYVEALSKEDTAILEWADSNGSALQDITLLLSIFTSREVFTVDSENRNSVFDGDPRRYQWGGTLRASIPYRASHSLERGEAGWEPPYNIGFEEGINQIYTLLRSEEWQRKYNKGYFLFLARMAFRRQPLESAFIQCWTVWEHLFSVLNSGQLSKKDIEQLDAAKKTAFILTEYALIDKIDNGAKIQIDSLKKTRNRLIHFGRFPPHGKAHNEALLFIQLTEFVIAKILGLRPSELFDTTAHVKEFLGKTPQNT